MGLDIVDVGGEGLSWRRLASILRRLPRDSHTMREVHGAKVEWTAVEYLLADVVDALHTMSWQLQGEKKAKRPPKVPRPGDVKDVAVSAARSPSEMREALLEQRRRRDARR